ncbi:MAG: threonine--tRNA ligase [Puniceicoccales bacterium]|jgi:threonyl-tRNA synthetase|nr:threonine--tRNA ligase [Puniceicoccales bacterium]
MVGEVGMNVMEARHSAAHVLAAAVLRLFPGTRLDIGPATTTGFYYDFDRTFAAEDLLAIEEEMRRIIAADLPIVRREITRDAAHELFFRQGQCYKMERLADIPAGEVITIYSIEDFDDLCRGPHVASTGKIGAIKLLSIAGAYYKGSEANRQLQRIYGTAFPTQAELDRHLQTLEEAKLRDHRKLGKELQLFTVDPEVGPGMVLWLPKGTTIRLELQKFIADELNRQGYEQVMTPHVARLELFRTSGHFPYYRDSQFEPIADREMLDRGMTYGELAGELESGKRGGFLIKPMNCPGHIKIFSSIPRSYRDLPCRFAEFGTVYRWEQSGELSGMTRVRGFTQDDAHIFCTDGQLEGEILGCLGLVQKIFQTLGMGKYRVRIGLRDPESSKYIGGDAAWEKAENALRRAVGELGAPFCEELGEAAFYGPKIDFIVRDVLGREWQLGTVQVDYNLPERFALSYAGSDNRSHVPVLIHRAPFGSLERFCGLLIEHFGGEFPLWLAPEQLRILPVNDEFVEMAEKTAQMLREKSLRVKVDGHSEPLGAKIRRAELDRIPCVGVLGQREAEAGTLSIRSRICKSLEGNYAVEIIAARLVEEIGKKSLPDGFSRP